MRLVILRGPMIVHLSLSKMVFRLTVTSNSGTLLLDIAQRRLLEVQTNFSRSIVVCWDQPVDVALKSLILFMAEEQGGPAFCYSSLIFHGTL